MLQISDEQKNHFYVKYRENHWGYDKFRDEVDRIVNWLKDRNVEDTAVALLESCNFYSFVLTVALNECHCLIMYMDVKNGEYVLNEMISYYKPDFILCNSEVGFGDGNCGNFQLLDVEYRVTKCKVRSSFNRTLLNDYPDSFIFFTSGTSSIPKAVLRSESCVIEDAINNIDTFNITSEDTVVCAVPFGHVYGFGSGVIPYYMSGASLVFLDPAITGKELGTTISENKASVFVGNPIHYQALMISWNEKINLRLALSAGSALLEEMNKKFENKYGFFINNMYGSSETGGITTLVNNDIEGSMKSCGNALKNVSIKCESREKNGEVAEIYIKSKSLAIGYLDYEDAKIIPITNSDGWYKSSDMGWIDNRGNLYISCRNNDIINVSGKKVSPQLLEEIIYTYDEKLHVVTTSEKNINGNEYVVAYFDSKQFDKDDLLRYLRKNMALIFVPKKLYYIDEFPKTNNGKIARRKLGDEYCIQKRVPL